MLAPFLSWMGVRVRVTAQASIIILYVAKDRL